jgi:hypothetical protein
MTRRKRERYPKRRRRRHFLDLYRVSLAAAQIEGEQDEGDEDEEGEGDDGGNLARGKS